MGVPDEAPKRGEKLARIIKGLSQPSSTRIERVRNVAAALELEKLAGLLGTTEGVMEVLRDGFERDENRYTIAEAAERAGLSVERFARLNLACGFANPAPDEAIFTDEDIETLRTFQAASDFFGEDNALQIVRVIGNSMSRCADAFISGFVHAIGDQSRKEGFTDDDIIRANEIAMSLLPGAAQTMDVLLRRNIERRTRTDALLLGKAWEGVDTIDRAIGFCDLVGYTALSQQISTEELAAVLRTFETDASDLITEKGGRVVKLIGDEIMYVATDAQTGVEIAISLAACFDDRRDVPPVRVGVAAGGVVAREGDYFGPVVNMAARLVKLAPPGSVLAPAEIRDKIAGVEIDDVGAETLKGFDEPVDVIRIAR
jgi:adenylate cyclase